MKTRRAEKNDAYWAEFVDDLESKNDDVISRRYGYSLSTIKQYRGTLDRFYKGKLSIGDVSVRGAFINRLRSRKEQIKNE